jgi:hypothetical protein
VPPVYAFCPVCIVAVGAGLGLSRYLGVDDTVSGIWVGGLLLTSSLWLVDWLVKKIKKLQTVNLLALQISSALLTYAIVLIPLWHSEIIGHPFNKILGLDKLIFGTAVGTILFLKALWLDKMVRKWKGHQLFDFQKVVFPVVFLLIGSLIMFFITKK